MGIYVVELIVAIMGYTLTQSCQKMSVYEGKLFESPRKSAKELKERSVGNRQVTWDSTWLGLFSHASLNT